MSKYIEALKRRKKGERHVEIISSLPKNKKDFVEQFRKEHPNTSTEWFDHRFNEKISLDEIVDLLDDLPVLKEHITVLSAGTVILYPIAKDYIKSFQNAILEQVSHEKSDRGELFLKRDVIRWMEEKAKTDSEFICRLNSDFVDDYKRRHPDFATENELLKKNEFFQLLAKDMIKETNAMNIPADMAFTIRACLAFCGFELNKNRKIYNKTGKIVSKLSYDTLRLYLRSIKLPAGKLKNRSRTERERMEKWLNWLKKRFDLEQYNVHKVRLEKLTKQGIFSKFAKKAHKITSELRKTIRKYKIFCLKNERKLITKEKNNYEKFFQKLTKTYTSFYHSLKDVQRSVHQFGLKEEDFIMKDFKEKFLRLPQILQLIPIGKSTLWEKVTKGEFPKQIKLGPKISVWKASDIQEYINSHKNGASHDNEVHNG